MKGVPGLVDDGLAEVQGCFRVEGSLLEDPKLYLEHVILEANGQTFLGHGTGRLWKGFQLELEPVGQGEKVVLEGDLEHLRMMRTPQIAGKSLGGPR